MGEAIITIAKLGGYLNRKSDRHPGYETLWKGYIQFRSMVRGFCLRQKRTRAADD